MGDVTINLINFVSFEYLCCMIVILQEEKVDSSLEFLILASDGLWDVVTNEVCNYIHFPFSHPNNIKSYELIFA
jgi:serine/threonine protein phosphatase PrpC